MKIGITSDHRGYKLKEKLTKYLKKEGYTIINLGTDSSEIVDYPDFGIKIGEEYIKGSFDFGIAICANGVGMSIACNKVKGIRCGKINTIKEAKYARRDDNINIISLPVNLSFNKIKKIVKVFLKTPFSTIDRYQRRIDKINAYEDKK
jgi:ribose 5-phosphate isomerase B